MLSIVINQNLYAQSKDLIYYRWDQTNQIYLEDYRTSTFESENYQQYLDSLQQTGYFTLKLDSIKTDLNAEYIYIDKGKFYGKAHLFEKLKDRQIEVGWLSNPDSLFNQRLYELDKQGYAFARIESETTTDSSGNLKTVFQVIPGEIRNLDGIRIQGYKKLPKAYLRHTLGLKQNNIYSSESVKSIENQLNENPHLIQKRKPQTLFTPDSTLVYIYVDKRKSNYFDGILGFGNDNNGDFRLNGNVLLELNNNFNAFESIRLHWNANDQRNSTLELSTRVPYLFRSAIGLDFDLRIFRKDSTFINTRLNPKLFYTINRHANLGASFSLENSNSVLADSLQTAGTFRDYNKSGFGLFYDYFIPNTHPLQEGKWSLNLIGNVLSVSDSTSRQQFEVGIKAFKVQRLFKKHYLKIGLEAFALFSEDDTFNQNELYRFGGFGSLRGFNEESLVANAYGIGLLEYRFVPNDAFYISTFMDFSLLENQSLDVQENLIGTGLGFSFLSRIGVFNLTYAVGKFSDAPFDFNNNRVHFGIVSRF